MMTIAGMKSFRGRVTAYRSTLTNSINQSSMRLGKKLAGVSPQRARHGSVDSQLNVEPSAIYASTRVRGLVIVVDDNRRLLAALEPMIRRAGFDPLLCGTYSEAISSIQVFDTPPIAVIIDVCLDRGHSGVELAGRFNQRYGSATKLLVMTGYRSAAYESEYEIAEKPIDAQKLRRFLVGSIVERIVQSGPLRDALLDMSERYSLSPQEAELLAAMSVGSGRAQLPRQLRRSSNTIKSQIRTLLAKTECKSMSGVLIHLVSELASPKMVEGQ